MFDFFLRSFTSASTVLFFGHKFYTSGILIDILKKLYHIFFKQKELIINFSKLPFKTRILCLVLYARQSSENVKTMISRYRQFYDFHTTQVVYKNNDKRLIIMTPDFRFSCWLH